MKKWMIGFGMLLISIASFAQQNISFSLIDWRMQSVNAPTPDSLARIINANFTTQLEKVRAIYSWITAHIEYNTAVYKPWTASHTYSPDPLDTAAVWPSGDEMVARKVMRKRSAVCDGYSRLFKVLCEYTGIEVVIVQGYARGIGNPKFRTNHSWNAVKIDATWHLLDVTWAAGHLNSYDDFVKRQNDYYFLTPPDQFIKDHYPEELTWTLLPNPSMPSEFKKAPFRSKHFYKYGVDSYLPNTGVIEAAVGDTIQFLVQLKDIVKAKQTSSDPFMDTATYSLWPLSAFIIHNAENQNHLQYSYIAAPTTQWLHLLYNGDAILRYKILIKEAGAVN